MAQLDEAWAPPEDGTDWDAVKKAIREADVEERELRQAGTSSSSRAPRSLHVGATSKAASNSAKSSKPPEPLKGKGIGSGRSGTPGPSSAPSNPSGGKTCGGKTSGSSGKKRPTPPWKEEPPEDYDEDEDEDERPAHAKGRGKAKGKGKGKSKDAWESPGVPAKSRRMLGRMRQEMLNMARGLAGLPISAAPLSRQIHWERTAAWTAQTRQEVSQVAAVEKAMGLQTHLVPGDGSWHTHPPAEPAVAMPATGHPPSAPAASMAAPAATMAAMGPGKGYPRPPGVPMTPGVPKTPGPPWVPLTPGAKPAAASLSGFLSTGSGKGKEYPPLLLHAIDPKMPQGP